MKRFSFALDPVLRYRAYRARLAWMELAEAKQRRLKAQSQMERIKREKKAVVGELTLKETQGMEVGYHRVYLAYLSGLDEQIVEAENHHSEMTEVVNEKRDRVERERIKKETLERLRERREQEYSRMVDRMEQKETDEILTLRFQLR